MSISALLTKLRRVRRQEESTKSKTTSMRSSSSGTLVTSSLSDGFGLTLLLRGVVIRRRRKKSKRPQPASVTSTFQAFGVLEEIMSFCDIPDLLSAATVNHRWKRAARNDLLWKARTKQLWTNKHGMPQNNNELFSKTLYADSCIRKMSKTMLLSMLKKSKKQDDGIAAVLPHDDDKDEEEKQLLRQQLIQQQQRQQQQLHSSPCCPIVFSDIWFGSYVASLTDSRRTIMTFDELTSPQGFVMYANKGIYITHEIPIVYYEKENNLFSWQDMHDSGNYPQNAETWKWENPQHTQVRVGDYAPLNVTRRRDDWNWVLQNKHVRLVLREE